MTSYIKKVEVITYLIYVSKLGSQSFIIAISVSESFILWSLYRFEIVGEMLWPVAPLTNMV